ncbi:MAG: hypothetical protein IJ379_00245 [Lachnospiraceae bacterium]|nr:hypothetical protein [Lachnospiraceae bacterium]
MSYCVNCGVELDGSLKHCPLCNTPVINPKELSAAQKSSPFPKEKAAVETVKRKDMGLLVTIVLLAIAITSAGLNGLVYNSNYWSVTIIGACLLLWVIMFPVIIYPKLHIYFSILFDGIAVLVYLYLITWLTSSNRWFYGLGIALVVFMTILVEIYVFCMRNLPKSILTYALYTVTAIGILCTGIELLIDWLVYDNIAFGWSTIVATVCIIIDVALICVLSMRRLRNAVRRRLHF